MIGNFLDFGICFSNWLFWSNFFFLLVNFSNSMTELQIAVTAYNLIRWLKMLLNKDHGQKIIFILLTSRFFIFFFIKILFIFPWQDTSCTIQFKKRSVSMLLLRSSFWVEFSKTINRWQLLFIKWLGKVISIIIWSKK